MPIQLARHLYARMARRFPAIYRLTKPMATLFRPKDGEQRVVPRGPGAGLTWVFARSYDVTQGLGTYEEDVQEALARWLGPGDTFVDVGGYAGFFSLLAARLVGPTGEVVCFEPHPGNRRMCETNFRVNGLDRIRLIDRALSSRDGTAEFACGENLSIAKFAVEGASEPRFEVRTCRLDGMELRAINCMKIDVEGFGGDVLAGATETLARSPGCHVIVEIHTPEELAGCLGAVVPLGYRPFETDGRTLDEAALVRGLAASHTAHVVLARAF